MANTGKFGSTGQEKVENFANKAGQFAGDVKNKAQETASSLTDKAKDMASSAGETAQQLAHRAGETATAVGHRAEETVSSVGGQMKSLAGTIREKAPHEGMLGSAAEGVASSLESGGRYLQEHDFSRMANDLTGLIRQYPLQAILMGFGIGFLCARATRS